MNDTGKKSSKVGREVSGLNSVIMKICGWKRDAEEARMTNMELVPMVIALLASSDEDYDREAVLEYYGMTAGLSDEQKNDISLHMDYYATLTPQNMIAAATERILYIYLNGRHAPYGKACSHVSLPEDVDSKEYRTAYQLVNTLPSFVGRIMGIRITADDEVDGSEAVNTALDEDDYAAPEYEKEEETPSPALELPMNFHWFWTRVALPVSAVFSALFVLGGIMSIGTMGGIIIVDILLNAGWFIFGIPALKGLYKFTRLGFEANRKLLAYLIGIRGVAALMLALLTGLGGIALYLPDLIWAGFGIGIRKYYEKRKDLFNK